jgi:hypothetical protein
MTTDSGGEALSPAEQRAARLLALAAVPPRALDSTGWQRVVARATQRRSDWLLVPAFLFSMLVGVAGVLAVQHLRPRSRPPPTLVVTAATRLTRQDSGVFALRSGRLSVPRGVSDALTIETPDLTIVSLRAAFLAEVVSGHTVVTVEEGEVVVRVGRAEHVVAAGQTFRWPDLPSELLQAPVLNSPCQSAPAQLECLEAQAKGDSLDAQAALYELGALRARQGDVDGAIATWTSSLARFPAGVLQPELRLALFSELLLARRFEEAQVVARDFERCCAADPRVDDVRRVAQTISH